MSNVSQAKTASEALFETYLRDRGISDFEYEPEVLDSPKRPDYRVPVAGEGVFFEVKEFERAEVIPDSGTFDPYPPIREKINDAQKQLRALKGRMCSVVLANPHNAFVHLDEISIIGAMLGNLGFTMPFDPDTQAFDASRSTETFLGGGKMIRYKSGAPVAPQNTTISAICVLSTVREGLRRFRIRSAKWERETGEKRTCEKVRQMTLEARGTQADAAIHRLRLVIYENPDAIAPLSKAFGMGPFDERFGVRESRLIRVFVGAGLQALEADERNAGVDDDDPLGLRRPK